MCAPLGASGHPHRFGIQTSSVVVVLLLGLAAASAAVVFVSSQGGGGGQTCDPRVLIQINATGSGFCLRQLNIVVSASNTSELYVPVLLMKPGSTATIDILYHISAGNYVSRSYEKPNVTSSDAPLALSIRNARINGSLVSFSNGSLIFQNEDWEIYRYTVSASSGSTGYYGILPPDYAGFYPALVVEPDSNSLNRSALALWGYDGLDVSGEVIVPSNVVGFSGSAIFNETLPITLYCPNQACVLMSRSFY